MKIATCHTSKKAKGRGLCGSCYDKWLKEKNPAYKAAQKSNTTLWKEKNPEKYRQSVERRKEKQRLDPNYKLKRRERSLKSKYNLSLLDYVNLLENQNNGCALCFRRPGKTPLHVDHDHVSGRVRGLLCHQCNWYLGIIDADPDILVRIPLYLWTKNYNVSEAYDEFQSDMDAKIST